jgi:hypothetical protein
VNGIDKIKTLKCTVTKKEIVKGRDGDLLVNNCGAVLFKQRKAVKRDGDDESD